MTIQDNADAFVYIPIDRMIKEKNSKEKKATPLSL